MSLKGMAVRWTTAASVLIINFIFSVWYWGPGTIAASLVVFSIVLVMTAKVALWVLLKNQKSLVTAILSLTLVVGLQIFQFWLSNAQHLKEKLIPSAMANRLEVLHHRILNVAGEEEIWLELKGTPNDIEQLIKTYKFPPTDAMHFPLLESPNWFPVKEKIKGYSIYLYNDYDKEELHLLLHEPQKNTLFYYYLDY